MSKLDEQAIEEFVSMVQELLEGAGFTGVKLEPAPLSDATIQALEAMSEDDEIPFKDPAFAEEVHNHRVTTDQGTFGIWFEPSVTLSIAGLGIDAKAFVPSGVSTEGMPDDWCLLGIDDGTLQTLFDELAKKSRQP